MRTPEDMIRFEGRVESKLDSLATEMGDCHEELTSKITRLDEVIRGNGAPGIQTRLALHEQRLDQLGAFVDEVHALKKWMTMGVLSLVGSLGWQAIQFLINQGPTP